MSNRWRMDNYSINIDTIRNLMAIQGVNQLTSFRVITDDRLIRNIGVGSTYDNDLADLIERRVENIRVEIQGRQAQGRIKSVNMKVLYGNNQKLSIQVNIESDPATIQIKNYLDIDALFIALDELRRITGINDLEAVPILEI